MRWGRMRRLTLREAELAAEQWRAYLGIRQELSLERVDWRQVTDESGRRGCSLVGVVYDRETACIKHTRALTADDVVHELLHVAHPDWSEAAVVAETERLFADLLMASRRRVRRLRWNALCRHWRRGRSKVGII